MKFSINRETLLPFVKLCAQVAIRATASPVLNNIHLQAEKESKLRVHSTDKDVELSCVVEIDLKEAGSAILSARKLLDMCNALPFDETISFSSADVEGEQVVKIKAGRNRFSLAKIPTEDYPIKQSGEEKFKHEYSLVSEKLRDLLNMTKFAMATEDARVFLNGILFDFQNETLTCVGCDGHRIAVARSRSVFGATKGEEAKKDKAEKKGAEEAKDDSEQSAEAGADEGGPRIIIPHSVVDDLLKILDSSKEIVLQADEDFARFSTPSISMRTNLLRGVYPQYKRLIPTSNEKVMRVVRNTVKDAVARAKVVTDAQSRVAQLTVYSDRLKITAEGSEKNKAEIEIDIEFKGPDEDLALALKIDYLLEMLQNSQADQLLFHLKDSETGCLIKEDGNDDYHYVVMPILI